MAESPLTVRLTPEMTARVERAAAELTKRSAGLNIGRSSVLKLAIERGLPLLEKELGLAKKPKRSTKK